MGAALVVSPQELWKLGSHERVQRRTPVQLVAQVNNGVAQSRYTTCRAAGATAGYQVTAGLSLVLTRLIFHADTAAVSWLIGDGTTDVGLNSVGSPAGMLARDAFSDGEQGHAIILAANTLYTLDTYLVIPAARFPVIRNLVASTGLWVLMLGVEV